MTSGSYKKVIAEVIGDVVEPFVPTVTMILYYGDSRVMNGSELQALVTQTMPRVIIGGEHDELYTLIMINPDAPSPSEPSLREVVSWIVTNIPGGTSCDQGTEFASYDEPNPLVGIHRYILLLYKQQSKLHEIDTLPSRVSFKAREFASKYGLKKPVGLSYFYVRSQAKRRCTRA